MDEELKRCPHCRGRAVQQEEFYDGRLWYSVMCITCFCGTASFSSKEKAIQVWNRRVYEHGETTE